MILIKKLVMNQMNLMIVMKRHLIKRQMKNKCSGGGAFILLNSKHKIQTDLASLLSCSVVSCYFLRQRSYKNHLPTKYDEIYHTSLLHNVYLSNEVLFDEKMIYSLKVVWNDLKTGNVEINKFVVNSLPALC